MDHDTEIPSSNLFGWFCIVSGSKSVDVFLSIPMFTRHQVSTSSTSEEYLVTGLYNTVKNTKVQSVLTF